MVPDSPLDADAPRSRAEAVFADFRRGVEAGEPADFDAVCRAHGDLETTLRKLKSQWELTVRHLDSGSRSDVLQRLRTQPRSSTRYQILIVQHWKLPEVDVEAYRRNQVMLWDAATERMVEG